MGYIRNDTILIDVWNVERDDPKLVAFRASLPEQWQRLMVGPVAALVNGSHYWAFLPDGSKEWWDTSDEGDEHRKRLVDLLEDGDWCYYAAVQWGGDHQAESGVTAWGN